MVCRQLTSESLGKKFDLNKKLVEIGIMPTVSIGTTDLHSMAQLYLSGPRDKFTTFVNVNEPGSLKQILLISIKKRFKNFC